MAIVRPAIGGFYFVSGQFPAVLAPTMRLEVIDRPGINGHEFRELGKRAPLVRWLTECDTANPATLEASYRALSGTLQTIINEDGSTVSVVRVELLAVTRRRVLAAVGGVVGTSGLWWVVAEWALQASV